MFGVDDLLMGGLSLGGSLMNNLFAGKRQDEQQAFNAQQASNQMAFQERMSNTAHQREASDLQAAGLNRILSVGKGASSPAGAMGSSTQTPVHDILGPAVNTAMAHKRLKEEVENMDEQNTNIKQDTEKKAAETYATYEQGAEHAARAQHERDRNYITVEQLAPERAKALKAKEDIDLMSNPAYRIAVQAGHWGEQAQKASSALGNLPSWLKTGASHLPADMIETESGDGPSGEFSKTKTRRHKRAGEKLL